MKHFLLIFFIFNISASFAQKSVPQPVMQQFEVQKAMTNICSIDQDSRQCEFVQSIALKNRSFASEEKYMEIDSSNPPGMLEYLNSLAKDNKSILNKIESEKKLQTSRMYKAIDLATEKICNIKLESQPCLEILKMFNFQAEIETGKKLNPPANIPQKIKQDVRKFISEEHPNMYPSSRLLLEAGILSEMQKNEKTLEPEPKEKQRKSKDGCENKYSSHYIIRDCQ